MKGLGRDWCYCAGVKTVVAAVIVAVLVAPGAYAVGQRSTYDAKQDARIAKLARDNRTQAKRLRELERQTAANTRSLAGSDQWLNQQIGCLSTDWLGVVLRDGAVTLSPDPSYDEFRLAVVNESCWHR